jgi:hypothetical protein
VKSYILAVQSFVKEIGSGKNAVDLGCGDFSVGSQLRPLFNNYTACDIVAPLIEFNKTKYSELNVEFRCLDAVTDDIPSADVIFIRQVLQHLSNADIGKILKNIHGKARHLVITEHLPATPSFTANREKPNGPGVRIAEQSGVVLTDPPFSLRAKSEKVICEVDVADGIVRTTVYGF